MDKEKLISSYIASQILGVAATVNSQGRPEAALVAITEVGNLELVFGTLNTTRKYKNLKKNPRVAITIGNDVEKAVTVQYEGAAVELEGSELERCRGLHIKKNPRSKKFANRPEQRWFKVTPAWVRYSDLAAKPQVEFELSPVALS